MPNDILADPALVADLRRQLAACRTERDEALAQRAASAEILQVINQSPGDLASAFDVILEKATRICEAKLGIAYRFDGDVFRVEAVRDATPAYIEYLRREPPRPDPKNALGRLLQAKQPIHIADIKAEPAYAEREPARVAAVEIAGARTYLAVPMLKEDQLIGAIAIYRQEVRPFSDAQIEMARTFANHAAIAIENARLLGALSERTNDLQEENTRLLTELRERTRDLKESLEYQTATSDVLRVISRSTFDLKPVLNTLVQTAARLCDADRAGIASREGDVYRIVATVGGMPEYDTITKQKIYTVDRSTLTGRAALEARVVHIHDITADPDYDMPETVTIGKMRTGLGVPLLREGEPIGVIALWREHVQPFTERQIDLVRTFADQAVIAIENTRLLTELRQRTRDLQESLEYQTATSDVLKVISRSGFNLQPVLDKLVETAMHLCRADQGLIATRDDGSYRPVSVIGGSPEQELFLRKYVYAPGRGTVIGRVLLEHRLVQVADIAADPEYVQPENVTLGGTRTVLGVPLLREGEAIGVLNVTRRRVEPFTERQIELVRTFADQAVIAIENTRLLTELRERTRDLQESLEYQTATSDVLKVISRSTFDLQPVLDTVVETAARLCQADVSHISNRDGEVYRPVASFALSPDYAGWLRQQLFAVGRGTVTGRTALERQVVHVADLSADPEFALKYTLGWVRTGLGVPLLREGEPIGVIYLARRVVEPFTERQIELVRTFADQAVIAIENARLLGELRERTEELTRREAELRVTFDNMGDGVVMFDKERRLAAWNRNFQQILELPDTVLAERRSYGEYFRYLAERGEFGTIEIDAEERRYAENVGRQWSVERTRPDGRVLEVRHNPVPGGGFVLIYGDITARKQADAEIRAARDASEAALRELKAAQANLIHSEKMASLGQLTAGIAHEIKNPLNFVNNFASLSNELLTELKDIAAPALKTLNDDQRAELDEVVGMLAGNLDKIVEHGRRADGIVKSMLAHSRGGSGDRQAVDLNALIEESLNLAYHGARAQDQNFNIALEREFDPVIKPIELVPQDITRVFLNLFGNGFYAANKRARAYADGSFRPVLRVATHDAGDAVEIRVRDNGVGIPADIRDKLFQPFFTTKPTGEGTGLGLSISYDIVTQQHGGAIAVDSEEGVFTEFTVRLPRGGRALPAKGLS